MGTNAGLTGVGNSYMYSNFMAGKGKEGNTGTGYGVQKYGNVTGEGSDKIKTQEMNAQSNNRPQSQEKRSPNNL